MNCLKMLKEKRFVLLLLLDRLTAQLNTGELKCRPIDRNEGGQNLKTKCTDYEHVHMSSVARTKTLAVPRGKLDVPTAEAQSIKKKIFEKLK